MRLRSYLFMVLFSFHFSFGTLAQESSFDHVEPSNWWTNMEHSKVEVLFHKENISEYTVACEGLNVLKTTSTNNPNFLFVTLETKNKNPGIYNLVFNTSEKKRKKNLTYSFELKARNMDSRNRKGFDQSDLIYLIMPDRFANGNESNDSHKSLYEKADRENPAGRHGGDLEGIIQRLDYIQELGATAIWTTPLMEDNDSVYSYHTYAQSDVYKIDPRFGVNEDYRSLVQEAQKRKIKIIQDVVTNHWGHMHWMMFDVPDTNWFHEFPEFTQSNFKMGTHMDPHRSLIDYNTCRNGWFVKTMPDLNQDHPLVLNYLIQNSIWWIEYAGLDGLRVDTYSFNSKEGVAKWTKSIMQEYPDFSIVGEIWMLDQAQIAFWQKNSPVAAIKGYNSGLPYVMDFTLLDAMSKSFKETEQGWNKGMLRLYENFINDFLYADANNLLVFFENHDTERFNERHPDIRDYKLALSLICTTRGIPQIYYGSEIGMKGERNFGDGDIRRDFPGGWKDDQHNAFIDSERTEEENAYFEFTKRLLNWRKNKKLIHKGRLMHYIPERNVYVYFRYTEDESVMVILNNALEPREIELNRFHERLTSFSAAEDILSNSSLDLKSDQLFKVEGKTVHIFELKK